MLKTFEKIPWAILSLSLQFLACCAAYYLYYIDFGYSNGRDFSFALSFSYFVLAIIGISGTFAALFGMGYTIAKEHLVFILIKLPLIFIPCLFLSVLWLYSCLVLLAYI